MTPSGIDPVNFRQCIKQLRHRVPPVDVGSLRKICTFRSEYSGRKNGNMKIDNRCSERLEQFRYLGRKTITNQITLMDKLRAG